MTFFELAKGARFTWLSRTWTKMSDSSYTPTGRNGPGAAKDPKGNVRTFAPNTPIEPV